MSNLNQEEARKFVEKIRKDNGGITTEHREALADGGLSDVLDALKSVRRQLANSIKTYSIFSCRESG